MTGITKNSMRFLISWPMVAILITAALATVVIRASWPEGGGVATADADAPPADKTPRPLPDSTGTPLATPSEVPPPALALAYFDKRGYIEIPHWDDRHLDPDEKAANPWINPRWAPFNRCMNAAGGWGVPERPMLVQADIDDIVARINVDGPFVERTPAGPLVRRTPAVDALLACAEQTLEVATEDLDSILQPGDPRDEAPR